MIILNCSRQCTGLLLAVFLLAIGAFSGPIDRLFVGDSPTTMAVAADKPKNKDDSQKVKDDPTKFKVPTLPPNVEDLLRKGATVEDLLRRQENWDFEVGTLLHWTPDPLDHFGDQPASGDPTWAEYLRAGVSAPVPLGGDYWHGPFPNGHQGNHWFTTYDHAGTGNQRQGSLRSKVFIIRHRYLSFLVSGGNDSERLRVELWVKSPGAEQTDIIRQQLSRISGQRVPQTPPRQGEFYRVLYATGPDELIMHREIWEVSRWLGSEAFIQIVDSSDRNPLGHISVDDFRFTDEPPPVLRVSSRGHPVNRDPQAPVWGFADLHAHAMAHLGFGGALFAGNPDGPIDDALLWIRDSRLHGEGGTGIFSEVGNLFITFFEGGVGHSNQGWPSFKGWPNFRSKIHQQMYIDWIRRAYEGGLRLMVALAVNNELLAKEFGDRRPYDDVTVVGRQIQAMKDMVSSHRDWMEIAYSPEDARRIIHSNKLAVVLGVEVDALGNFKRESDCTEEQVGRYLQQLYEQGVRQITPIHLADNAFGGAAIYNDLFSVLNLFLRGEYFDVDCSPNVQFRLGEHEDIAVGWYRRSGWYTPPDYANICRDRGHGHVNHGHVNRKGLTNLGRFLINRMMNLGMLIDIDHMSERATNEVLDIFESRGYPPVSSHTGFRELAWGRGETSDIHKLAHESLKTREQVERIARLGGIVAPIANQGDVRAFEGGPVPNDCPGSSKTWAQAYLYAVSLMPGRGVAIGTDFNGLAGEPSPRFGTFASYGLRNDEIRNRSLSRRASADAQRNGVRYQTPVSDYRAYRFEEAEDLGFAVERSILGWRVPIYNLEERDIWEAIAIYKSGKDPAQAQEWMPREPIRTWVQRNKIANIAKGFRAERYEQLEDPFLFGGATFIEQLAAFMVKVGESNWRRDERIVRRYTEDEELRRLYEVISRIWRKWHDMEGGNSPLVRSTAGYLWELLSYREPPLEDPSRPRDFDINLDGLAHYGMLPDFIQDLKNCGMSDEHLQPLLRSAEEYIRVWERAVERSRAGAPAPVVLPGLPEDLLKPPGLPKPPDK